MNGFHAEMTWKHEEIVVVTGTVLHLQWHMQNQEYWHSTQLQYLGLKLAHIFPFGVLILNIDNFITVTIFYLIPYTKHICVQY